LCCHLATQGALRRLVELTEVNKCDHSATLSRSTWSGWIYRSVDFNRIWWKRGRTFAAASTAI